MGGNRSGLGTGGVAVVGRRKGRRRKKHARARVCVTIVYSSGTIAGYVGH